VVQERGELRLVLEGDLAAPDQLGDAAQLNWPPAGQRETHDDHDHSVRIAPRH
jgi:hypothetical protein